MLDDTLYKDKPPKKRHSKKQGKDENQCKQPNTKSTNKDQASKGNNEDDDNILLYVSLMINSSTIDKYNEDLKNNTIGKGITRGKKKRVKKVAGIAGDDAEQSQQITHKSARRAGK
jgi:hypothetical protein